MTLAEKTAFVNELAASVIEGIVAKLPDAPEFWDGHELRQYMADKFAEQTSKLAPNRKKAYKNQVLVNNL